MTKAAKPTIPTRSARPWARRSLLITLCTSGSTDHGMHMNVYVHSCLDRSAGGSSISSTHRTTTAQTYVPQAPVDHRLDIRQHPRRVRRPRRRVQRVPHHLPHGPRDRHSCTTGPEGIGGAAHRGAAHVDRKPDAAPPPLGVVGVVGLQQRLDRPSPAPSMRGLGGWVCVCGCWVYRQYRQ